MMINTTVLLTTMLTGILADFIILKDFRMRRRLFLIVQWSVASLITGLLTPHGATQPVVMFGVITAVGRIVGFAAWIGSEHIRVRHAVRQIEKRRGI